MMVDKWVFQAGVWLLVLAILVLFRVLIMQARTFQRKTTLQPLKRLLFGSILALVFAALPLLIVYIMTIWYPKLLGSHSWIVYAAVISNAASKLVSAVLFYLIYKYDGVS